MSPTNLSLEKQSSVKFVGFVFPPAVTMSSLVVDSVGFVVLFTATMCAVFESLAGVTLVAFSLAMSLVVGSSVVLVLESEPSAVVCLVVVTVIRSLEARPVVAF